MKYSIFIFLILFASSCYAKDIYARNIDIRAKAVEKAAENVMKSVEALQQHWETIPPKSKEECLEESKGDINNIYVRCRNGRQEFVRIDTNGRRLVTHERPIPANSRY